MTVEQLQAQVNVSLTVLQIDILLRTLATAPLTHFATDHKEVSFAEVAHLIKVLQQAANAGLKEQEAQKATEQNRQIEEASTVKEFKPTVQARDYQAT